MRRECERVEEAIWEHARTGRGLPDGVKRHIDGCPECKRALAEAVRISEPLQGAYAVPPTPDCRSAVMASISRRARRPVAVWAYACAAVLLAALAITAVTMLGPRPERPTKQVARTVEIPSSAPEQRVKPARDVAEGDKADLQSPAPEPSVIHPPTSQEAVAVHKPAVPRVRTYHAKKGAPRSLPKRVSEQRYPAVEGPPEPAPAEEHRNDDRPVALVMVKFPTAIADDTRSYGYTERDTQTGEVTRCSVTRSEGSIEIYLESTPGGEQPPLKGSLDHDKNTSV